MLKKNKTKAIKNTFSLIQVKRMIGKKLLLLHKTISVTDELKNKSKLLKEKLIESFKKNKTCCISAMCSNGILQVIHGAEALITIMSISYTDIKAHNISECPIEIIQYPKLTKGELDQIFLKS